MLNVIIFFFRGVKKLKLIITFFYIISVIKLLNLFISS